MQAAIFSYSRKGATLSLKVKKVLQDLGYAVTAHTTPKYTEVDASLLPSKGCVAEAEKAFASNSVIIYIGATGIAIRAIAPWIKSKVVDPAIINIDERGIFVISLLSGHIGGANALTKKIASSIGGQAVITTATDINHLLSVDEWATKRNYYITSLAQAKEFAAALVDGEKVGLQSIYPLEGTVPPELVLVDKDISALRCGLVLDKNTAKQPFKHTLTILPRVYTLGIGCRKNIECEAIEAFVTEQLQLLGIDYHAVKQVCSIDLKEHEAGLLTFCAKHKLPSRFYTSEELSQVPGDFTESALVQRVTGVGNVCERAALLGSSMGERILKKTTHNGVTLAIARETIKINFDEE